MRPPSRPKRSVPWAAVIIVGILLAGPLLIFGGRLLVFHIYDTSRFGPKHTFELPSRPAFLTDDLAVEKAKETLARDDIDSSKWKPLADDRTQSPEGVADKFLVRNSFDPNKGFVMFVGPARQSRIVFIELNECTLQCQNVRSP